MRFSRPRTMVQWAGLVLTLSVFVASPSLGQAITAETPPLAIASKRIGEGLGSEDKTLLLQNPVVQKELALTPAQRSRVKAAQEECTRAEQAVWQAIQPRFSALAPRFDPDAVAAINRRAQADMDAIGRRREEAMLMPLDRRQRTRLNQIHHQAEGPVAFCRPEVQDRLHLDPKQVQTIPSLVQEGFRRLNEDVHAVAASVPPATGPLTPDRSRALYESKAYQEAFRKQGEIVQRVRNETLQAITKLLDKKQQAAYQAMLGASFNFNRQRGDKPPKAS